MGQPYCCFQEGLEPFESSKYLLNIIPIVRSEQNEAAYRYEKNFTLVEK